jgi:glycosyltransferase involved in cell wall biosynthesis
VIVSMLGLRAPGAEGGVEMAVGALAPRLVARGWRVRLVCRAGWLPADFAPRGVEIVELPAPRGAGREALVHTLRGLPTALRGADLVHLHAAGPAGVAPLVRLAGRASVVTLHGADWARSRWGPVASAALRLAWRAAQSADAIIAVSTSLLPLAGGVGATWIPNGVDPLPEAAIEEAGIPALQPGFWLTLGRVVPEKDLGLAIRAHRAIPGAPTLVIAGSNRHDPAEYRRLEALAGPGVVFAGPRFGRQKAALLRHAGLLLAPSRIEGLPLAILEAMACGTPILASDIPAHRELLGAALGPAPGDDAGWIHALGAFDPADARVLARERAPGVLSAWSWDAAADRTDAVYRAALAHFRRRRGG